LALFALALQAAEYLPGRYIVELQDEPVLDTPGKSARFTSRSARQDAVRSAQARVRTSIEARGLPVVDAVETVVNAVVVEASETEAAALAALPGVKRVHPVRLHKRLLDRAVNLQRAQMAWDMIGGSENAGRGIRVGIIDTGIDATHPGLQDTALTAPDGFPRVGLSSDIANTNSKIIVARNYDRAALTSARDTEGHGTGVAMIAAGRTVFGTFGPITGIAPKAFLGNYKVFPDGSEGAPDDYILRAIEDAIADGMDIVNLSLGSFPAERIEDDILVAALERASAAGVIVVVAAGNEGPDAATIGTPATAPSAISVGNAYSDRTFGVPVTLDGGSRWVSLPGSGPNSGSPISGLVKDVAELDPSGLACSPLPADSLRGQIAVILRGVCLFSEKINIAQQAGAVAAVVYTHAQEPRPIVMSVGEARLPGVMISNEDGLALRAELRAKGVLTGTVEFPRQAMLIDSRQLGDSSSKGPSVDHAIKPEILAVGTHVYTAGTQPAFQVGTGTSFSSPMVAGAAAVLKAARPGLTAAQYKSLLINNASIFMNAAGVLPIQQAGAGLLDLFAAVTSTISASPQVLSFGAGSGTFEQSKRLLVTNLGAQAGSFSVNLVPYGGAPMPDVNRRDFQLAPGASEELIVSFNGSSTTPGDYSGLIVVRGPAGEIRVPYWYAVASTSAANIMVIDGNPNATNSASSRQIFFLRPTDLAGIAVAGEPKVTVEKGDGSLNGIQQSSVYPGFYRLDVRLGPVRGENVFVVEAGGLQRRITVTAE
jgi:subtilisin family serine protease